MPGLPTHIVGLGSLRRIIHLVLLIVVVLGVRACGGATEAEDRLGATTRWMAEKTGLTVAKQSWDRTVRPRITAATRTTSDAVYAAVSRTLDNVEATGSSMTTWVKTEATAATATVVSGMRSVVGLPAPPPEPKVPTSPQSDNTDSGSTR
jgi:hypothetical protein